MSNVLAHWLPWSTREAILDGQHRATHELRVLISPALLLLMGIFILCRQKHAPGWELILIIWQTHPWAVICMWPHIKQLKVLWKRSGDRSCSLLHMEWTQAQYLSAVTFGKVWVCFQPLHTQAGKAALWLQLAHLAAHPDGVGQRVWRTSCEILTGSGGRMGVCDSKRCHNLRAASLNQHYIYSFIICEEQLVPHPAAYSAAWLCNLQADLWSVSCFFSKNYKQHQKKNQKEKWLSLFTMGSAIITDR